MALTKLVTAVDTMPAMIEPTKERSNQVPIALTNVARGDLSRFFLSCHVVDLALVKYDAIAAFRLFHQRLDFDAQYTATSLESLQAPYSFAHPHVGSLGLSKPGVSQRPLLRSIRATTAERLTDPSASKTLLFCIRPRPLQ